MSGILTLEDIYWTYLKWGSSKRSDSPTIKKRRLDHRVVPELYKIVSHNQKSKVAENPNGYKAIVRK